MPEQNVIDHLAVIAKGFYDEDRVDESCANINPYAQSTNPFRQSVDPNQHYQQHEFEYMTPRNEIYMGHMHPTVSEYSASKEDEFMSHMQPDSTEYQGPSHRENMYENQYIPRGNLNTTEPTSSEFESSNPFMTHVHKAKQGRRADSALISSMAPSAPLLGRRHQAQMEQEAYERLQQAHQQNPIVGPFSAWNENMQGPPTILQEEGFVKEDVVMNPLGLAGPDTQLIASISAVEEGEKHLPDVFKLKKKKKSKSDRAHKESTDEKRHGSQSEEPVRKGVLDDYYEEKRAYEDHLGGRSYMFSDNPILPGVSGASLPMTPRSMMGPVPMQGLTPDQVMEHERMSAGHESSSIGPHDPRYFGPQDPRNIGHMHSKEPHHHNSSLKESEDDVRNKQQKPYTSQTSCVPHSAPLLGKRRQAQKEQQLRESQQDQLQNPREGIFSARNINMQGPHSILQEEGFVKEDVVMNPLGLAGPDTQIVATASAVEDREKDLPDVFKLKKKKTSKSDRAHKEPTDEKRHGSQSEEPVRKGVLDDYYEEKRAYEDHLGGRSYMFSDNPILPGVSGASLPMTPRSMMGPAQMQGLTPDQVMEHERMSAGQDSGYIDPHDPRYLGPHDPNDFGSHDPRDLLQPADPNQHYYGHNEYASNIGQMHPKEPQYQSSSVEDSADIDTMQNKKQKPYFTKPSSIPPSAPLLGRRRQAQNEQKAQKLHQPQQQVAMVGSLPKRNDYIQSKPIIHQEEGFDVVMNPLGLAGPDTQLIASTSAVEEGEKGLPDVFKLKKKKSKNKEPTDEKRHGSQSEEPVRKGVLDDYYEEERAYEDHLGGRSYMFSDNPLLPEVPNPRSMMDHAPIQELTQEQVMEHERMFAGQDHRGLDQHIFSSISQHDPRDVGPLDPRDFGPHDSRDFGQHDSRGCQQITAGQQPQPFSNTPEEASTSQGGRLMKRRVKLANNGKPELFVKDMPSMPRQLPLRQKMQCTPTSGQPEMYPTKSEYSSLKEGYMYQMYLTESKYYSPKEDVYIHQICIQPNLNTLYQKKMFKCTRCIQQKQNILHQEKMFKCMICYEQN
ncbi:hypothetical protein LOTGIDRAFT_160473 [Lottia gigantea]|uniref:Uncharacterized protein n=1 Tax=Lottia gigantea TaxID=225164 RepID=V4AER9_LOTGI|nr:hypothetical protein LOTGIDRAFT_160473 [Lottia gigantea]ESO95342.1 hypothetical protein LOTGIDRAFT_160473 [Lottia gigantea]